MATRNKANPFAKGKGKGKGDAEVNDTKKTSKGATRSSKGSKSRSSRRY